MQKAVWPKADAAAVRIPYPPLDDRHLVTRGLLKEALGIHQLFAAHSSECPERERTIPYPSQWEFGSATQTPDEKKIVLRSENAISEPKTCIKLLEPRTRSEHAV